MEALNFFVSALVQDMQYFSYTCIGFFLMRQVACAGYQGKIRIRTQTAEKGSFFRRENPVVRAPEYADCSRISLNFSCHRLCSKQKKTVHAPHGGKIAAFLIGTFNPGNNPLPEEVFVAHGIEIVIIRIQGFPCGIVV